MQLKEILFPRTARDDAAIISMLWKFLLIGLLIRFLFMPFACHADLLSEYWRAHVIAYHFDLAHPYSFIDILHGIMLFGLKGLMPGNIDLYFHPWGYSADIITQVEEIAWGTSSVNNWLTFISQDSIFRILFLFKLPYLIFDLASAFLCLHIFEKDGRGIKIFIFWMLNPVIIYSAYIFGRFDVLILFFILMIFYSIKRWNIRIGSLFLGLSILSRGFTLLLLPLYLLLEKELLGKLKILILALSPLILWKILSGIFFSGGMDSGISSLTGSGLSFLTPRFVNSVLATQVDSIALFVVGYILLILILYPQANDIQDKPMAMIYYLNDLFLIVMCLLFAFGSMSMHYFVWIVPFLVIKASESRELFYAHLFVIIGWLLFWVTYMTEEIGSAILGAGLFASINPAFTEYTTIGTLIVEWTALPHTSLVVIARSLWVATLLYLIYKTMQGRRDAYG
jgi:hypothetical protein